MGLFVCGLLFVIIYVERMLFCFGQLFDFGMDFIKQNWFCFEYLLGIRFRLFVKVEVYIGFVFGFKVYYYFFFISCLVDRVLSVYFILQELCFDFGSFIYRIK